MPPQSPANIYYKVWEPETTLRQQDHTHLKQLPKPHSKPRPHNLHPRRSDPFTFTRISPSRWLLEVECVSVCYHSKQLTQLRPFVRERLSWCEGLPLFGIPHGEKFLKLDKTFWSDSANWKKKKTPFWGHSGAQASKLFLMYLQKDYNHTKKKRKLNLSKPIKTTCELWFRMLHLLTNSILVCVKILRKGEGPLIQPIVTQGCSHVI